MPGYTWVNDYYTEAEISGSFAMDKGDCIRESDQTYPYPRPIENPDELYYECMSEISREESYPVKTEDGKTVYRTVKSRGNPYQCRPSREHRDAYREYEYVLRQQQSNRAKHVNSCLFILGWERIKNVPEPG
jgi:hypothetical protein